MKKLALTAAAVSVLFAGAASAADLPARTYSKAPAAAPMAVYDWTGFYVGVDIGGRWSDPSWNTTCLQPGFVAACVPGNFPTRTAFNNNVRFDSSSLKGGVYGGYNWQIGSWVTGVEGDFQWASNSKTLAGIPGAESPTTAGSPGFDSSRIRQTWDASLRARLGFLVAPSVLLFGTGGVAFTHVDSTATCGTVAFPVGWCNPGGPFLNTSQTSSTDRVGWTVGAGIEAMIAPNWLLRGEYRYADYGKFSSTVFSGFNGTAVNGDAIAFDTALRTHTATVGIAYKFGGPVVARY